MKNPWKKKEPQYLLTYQCAQCNMKWFGDEFMKPQCYKCGKDDDLVFKKKEKRTVQALEKSALQLNQYLIDSLEQDLATGNFSGRRQEAKAKKELADRFELHKELEKRVEQNETNSEKNNF